MDNGLLTTVPMEKIHIITKNKEHLPSNNSLRGLRNIFLSIPILKLYKFEKELYYTSNFKEIALHKSRGGRIVKAEIVNAQNKDEIIYDTICNSFVHNVGILKQNQFRFDLVSLLSDPEFETIKKHTGLTEKQISQFSFHKDMSKKGKLYAVKNRDLAMLNKIWNSPVLRLKSPHILGYIEHMRINQNLNTNQFFLIEKYARSVLIPFHKSKKIYENQIYMLLSERELREQYLFHEIQARGFDNKFPPVA